MEVGLQPRGQEKIVVVIGLVVGRKDRAEVATLSSAAEFEGERRFTGTQLDQSPDILARSFFRHHVHTHSLPTELRLGLPSGV